jgi:hypothetical protein
VNQIRRAAAGCADKRGEDDGQPDVDHDHVQNVSPHLVDLCTPKNNLCTPRKVFWERLIFSQSLAGRLNHHLTYCIIGVLAVSGS